MVNLEERVAHVHSKVAVVRCTGFFGQRVCYGCMA